MSDSPSIEAGINRQSLIIATAGHVDHGKTSLVHHLTGVDTDTLAEEKSRGLTINLGYAYHHYDSLSNGENSSNTLGFVDVPGHRDFINNMLAGVGSVDVALLVIAADDGIMPQTREHLAIIDLLGISKALVAVTKIDRVSESQLQKVSADIHELIQSTALGATTLFPVSNLDGSGIPALRNQLYQYCEQRRSENTANLSQYFRYLIDRRFTVKGIGTVVTGSVRAGTIRVGESALLSGSGETTRIKGLRQDTRDVEEVLKGQRSAANLSQGHQQIHRGDWLVDPQLFHPTHRLDVSFTSLEPGFVFRSSAQYHLHLGAAHHVVNIRRLSDTELNLFQIKSDTPLIAHYGDRFVIRSPESQHTLGGGEVIDIFIPRRGRASQQRMAFLQAMQSDSQSALSTVLIQQPSGVNLREFSVCRNINTEGLDGLLAELAEQQIEFLSLVTKSASGPILLHKKYATEFQSQVISQLESYHRSHSNQQGLSEPALSKSIEFDRSHLLFSALIEVLLSDGLLVRSGTLLHLPQHSTSLSAEEKGFLDKIRPILLEAGNIPPRTRELEELTGIPLKALDKILKQTAKAGNLVQVAVNRYFLPETIMQLAEFTEELGNRDEGFSVIEFRDASGIGRNLCIEILEYFDSIGFTRREGNSRLVRTDKENIFGK